MQTVAWQCDYQGGPSLVDFVDVPDGARLMFDIAEAAKVGRVIADIEGSVVTTTPTDFISFADWCRTNLRGRSKNMIEARATAVGHGWLRARKGNAK